MPRRASRVAEVLTFADLKGRRVRAYIRESSVRQADADRFGPAIQRAGIRAFCAKYGLEEPQHWYFDKATGRTVDGRTQLQQAYEDRGQYDVLIFFNTSRSFRNREDAATWKPKLRRVGLTLVFAEQEIISGDPKSKSTEFIHEFADEQRSDEQSMFVRSSLRQKFERGMVNGTAPIGYERLYGPPGDARRGELVTDASGKATVRAIWDLALTGKCSDAVIATRLNAERDADGLPVHRSRRGAPLTPSAVRIILTTRTYTGVTVWHPGTEEELVRPATHEAIVSPEEFERMAQVRRARAHLPGRAPTRARVYPLSRRARCYECCRPYVGDAGGKGGYMRMRHVFGECGNPRTIAWSLLDEQMGVLLSERLTLPDSWRREVVRAIATPAPVVDPALQRRRQEVERATKKLAQLYQWSDMDETEYRAARRRLEGELRQLERDQPSAEPVRPDEIVRAGELLGNIGMLWAYPGVSPQAKKEFIEEAFDEIQLDRSGIRDIMPSETYRPLVAVSEVGGFGAGDRIRTGDPLLGKQMLCRRETKSVPPASRHEQAIRGYVGTRNRPAHARETTWSHVGIHRLGCQGACKPNSVPRPRAHEAAAAAIHLGRRLPAASSDLPGDGAGHPSRPPI